MTRSKSTGIWPWTATRHWLRSARRERSKCSARLMTVDEVLDEVEKDARSTAIPGAASP